MLDFLSREKKCFVYVSVSALVCVVYTCLGTPLSGVSLSWSGGTVLGRRCILSAAH